MGYRERQSREASWLGEMYNSSQKRAFYAGESKKGTEAERMDALQETAGGFV